MRQEQFRLEAALGALTKVRVNPGPGVRLPEEGWHDLRSLDVVLPLCVGEWRGAQEVTSFDRWPDDVCCGDHFSASGACCAGFGLQAAP